MAIIFLYKSTLNFFAQTAYEDSLDWKGISANEIAQRVLEKSTNGSIILFHNAAENTPEALPQIIEGLIADGYSFKKVSELIYTEDYSIDYKGMQFKN